MDSQNGSTTLCHESGTDLPRTSSQEDRERFVTDGIYRTPGDLKRLREELIMTRVALREKRECLADYRAKTSDALAKAVDYMRATLSSDASSIPKNHLSDMLEFLQSCHESHSSAVSEYEELETEYSQQEKRLTAKEWELNKDVANEQAYPKLDSSPIYPEVPSSTLTIPSGDDEQQWSVHQPEEDALMSQYSAQIDQVVAREEKLMDLRRDKEIILDKKERSALFGLDSAPEEEFLDNYDSLEQELTLELEDSRAVLASMQAELENRKLEIDSISSKQSSETERASETANKASSTVSDDERSSNRTRSSEESRVRLPYSTGPARPHMRRRSMSDSALYNAGPYQSHNTALAAIRGSQKRQSSSLQRQFDLFRDRIVEWMSDALTFSRLDQAQLRSQVDSASALSGEDWWVMVRKHWHRDGRSDGGIGQARSEQLRKAYSAYSEDGSG